jgi:LCP family protein required for cell wall assembly
MTNEDPFKGWYQQQQPPAGDPADATRDMTMRSPMPGSDATQDMTMRSPMPPAGGPGAGAGAGRPGVAGPGANDPGYGGQGQGYSGQGYGGAPPGGAWPAQPPASSSPGSGYSYGTGYGNPPARTGRRWRFWGRKGRRGRRITLIIGIVVLVLIASLAGSYFWVDGKLHKSVALPAFTGTSAGTNWLIAGSDQRTGISRAERAKLHLGSVGADASDSLMLLHMGGPRPVLVSIPRDSYVPIPGHGSNKINAALAFGGPKLLVQTVETVTGLRIDHYMSIGFGGLAGVVNSVGGVRICVKAAIAPDPFSGFKGMKAGCHNLSGPQAIAFVRDRHSFATSDLQRIEDQRAFLSALLSKATSPGVYLNPFTALPFASTAAGAIAVDKGTSLYDLLQAALALRGPQTGTVPIANAALQTNAGEAVQWNHAQALALFNALKDNKPVPKGLLTGTKVGS